MSKYGILNVFHVYGLFNDAANSFNYTASNDEMISKKLEVM
jgi:hypothetical protein